MRAAGKEGIMYYYNIRKDDTVLSVPNWTTLKDATEAVDLPVELNLNFIDINEEEKNLPVKFYPNDKFDDGRIETEAPAALSYDLKTSCLEIMQNYLDDEDNYDIAQVISVGKYYPATLESPEEYPDLEYYCYYCGSPIGCNEEIGSKKRCKNCGAVNKIEDYVE